MYKVVDEIIFSRLIFDYL